MNTKPFTSASLLGLLAMLFLLSACAPPKPGKWKNDQIESGKRNDFHTLNTRLLTELKVGKADYMQDMMSKDFMADVNRYRAVELVSNRLKEDDYTILDEYYIVNAKKGQDSLKNSSRQINDYKVIYDGDTREMYIAFFVPKNIPNKWMFTAIYNKYDYGWKLSRLDVGHYTSNGKTAPELYELAKEYYAKKYMVDAANTLSEASDCLRPYEGWQYPVETAVSELAGKVTDIVNRKYYNLYPIAGVNTNPRVFRVFTQTSKEGVFPVIYYLTRIKLSDTVALKKENAIVQKMIGKTMPGVDKNNKYIYYSAFNAMPDGSKTFDHFDMIQKLQ